MKTLNKMQVIFITNLCTMLKQMYLVKSNPTFDSEGAAYIFRTEMRGVQLLAICKRLAAPQFYKLDPF